MVFLNAEGLQPEWLTGAMYRPWRSFLSENGLEWEGDADRTLLLRNGEEICACASVKGEVVKYIAVKQSLREAGASAKAVSLLLEDALSRGKTHLFLFTKTHSAESFTHLGFSEICTYRGAALLEWGFRGIEHYKNELSKTKAEGVNAAIVMNANPFTLGHRHLIETASKAADRVHLFMVSEDESIFPFRARLQMVEDGIRGMENVYLHPGSRYILSHVTFPSYFIKEASEKSAWQAGLDVTLFAKHIAPACGAQIRFVGQEPFDEATRAYNRKMHEILPENGIRVIEIERFTALGECVSASRVRERLKQGMSIKGLVPESTERFLASDEGQTIIGRLKESGN